MNTEDLINSAHSFNNISVAAAKEYAQKAEYLASLVQARLTEVEKIDVISNFNESMLNSNTANHTRFIAAILEDFNADVFVNTIVWVFRTYLSHGFKTEFWHVFLNLWIEAIGETLSFEAKKDIIPLYEWLIAHINDFVKLANKSITV